MLYLASMWEKCKSEPTSWSKGAQRINGLHGLCTQRKSGIAFKADHAGGYVFSRQRGGKGPYGEGMICAETRRAKGT